MSSMLRGHEVFSAESLGRRRLRTFIHFHFFLLCIAAETEDDDDDYDYYDDEDGGMTYAHTDERKYEKERKRKEGKTSAATKKQKKLFLLLRSGSFFRSIDHCNCRMKSSSTTQHKFPQSIAQWKSQAAAAAASGRFSPIFHPFLCGCCCCPPHVSAAPPKQPLPVPRPHRRRRQRRQRRQRHQKKDRTSKRRLLPAIRKLVTFSHAVAAK
jgi:hypothetical protein